ncbi:MAG TPA: OsmC family peroxiredoxin [Bacteroidia bacterium]|nr:OsmC family peroxiredoxin [Bacteroidia bacterium]
MKRTATAVWRGPVKFGSGIVSTETGALKEASYSWHSRFAEGTGTNPEELLAAAHAGCFSMKLSGLLTEAGFPPDKIETTAAVEMKDNLIVASHLTVKAEVPGVSEHIFQQSAEDAKLNCPMSKALAIEVTLKAELVSTHVET